MIGGGRGAGERRRTADPGREVERLWETNHTDVSQPCFPINITHPEKNLIYVNFIKLESISNERN